MSAGGAACDPDALRIAVDALDLEVSQAVESANGARLCNALLQAAAGLARPGHSLWPTVGKEPGPEEKELLRLEWAQEQLRSFQEPRLRGLVITCLSCLDLRYRGTRFLARPALWHIKALLDSSDVDLAALQTGRLQWRKIRRLVELGTGGEKKASMDGRRRRRRIKLRKTWRKHKLLETVEPLPQQELRKFCSVDGCGMSAQGRRLTVDKHGPPGLRCRRHAGRHLCNVLGCMAISACKVWVDDTWGPAGLRCIGHGARQCNVPDCKVLSVATVTAADEYGPPGRRCFQHGMAAAHRCNVAGCMNKPIKLVKEGDALGPPGLRCRAHGGRRCSVPGCVHTVWGRRIVSDEHGPPGPRCSKHGARQCCVPGCALRTRWGSSVLIADGLPPGPRCHRHGGQTCQIEGCQSEPIMRKRTADELGPAGLRCSEHSPNSQGGKRKKSSAPMREEVA